MSNRLQQSRSGRRLCRIPKCGNSVIIEHKNGNTLDNNVSNLAVLAYLPTGNHIHRDDCERGKWTNLPILTHVQVNRLRASGRTTDLDMDRNE